MVYGNPPGAFTFTTAETAGAARDTVVAALNADGALALAEPGFDEIYDINFLIGYNSFEFDISEEAPIDVWLLNTARGTREDQGLPWVDTGGQTIAYFGESRTFAEFQVVPIPAAVWLLGGGLVGLLGLRRRFQK